MAVRFDASGESYSRSLGLGSVSAFTVSMWVKLATNRAVSTILWQIDSGTADWLTVRAWDGSALAIETDGEWNALLGHTLTVGTWCYVGVGAETSGPVSRVIGDAGGALSVSTPNFGATAFNATVLRIGVGGAAPSWLDGSVAAVKVWSGVRLTTDELELESRTYLPRRTSSLTAWYPFLAPSTVDSSGNAQTLSGGTGAATDDGPPVSWSTGRHRAVIPLPDVSGSISATLPSLSASGAGTVEAAGTLSGTLPKLTGAALGVVEASGTVTAVLPPLAAALAGQIPVSSLTAVLPPLAATLTGAVETSGTLAAVLPPLGASLVGALDIPSGDITITATGATRGWAAGTPGDGWDSGTLTRGWTSGTPTT